MKMPVPNCMKGMTIKRGSMAFQLPSDDDAIDVVRTPRGPTMTTQHTIHRSDLSPGDTMAEFRQRVDDIAVTPQWGPLVMEWETQPPDSPWTCTVHLTAFGDKPTAKDLAFAALHVAAS